jgi:hypothetical protein
VLGEDDGEDLELVDLDRQMARHDGCETERQRGEDDSENESRRGEDSRETGVLTVMDDGSERNERF